MTIARDKTESLVRLDPATNGNNSRTARFAVGLQISLCAAFCKSAYSEGAQATSLKRNKRLAEEAVISEPVSRCLFPVSRENTGKFTNLRLEIVEARRLSEENSIPYHRNSLVAKAGKIYGRSGNPRRVTANLIPIMGLAFGATQSLTMRSLQRS
jgi:hypothetical protein